MTNDSKLLQEESNPIISDIFQNEINNKTAALAIIASYHPAKISPSKRLWAEIGLQEELNVEDAIYTLKEKEISNLFLIVNSFGGSVSSSFKVSYAIRKNFDNITVFIPHIAASGGTLIALTGDEIIMGDMSTITPIDIQRVHNGETYSVNAMIRSFSALNSLFKDTSEEDAPYPWKAMADKLDPVEFQEWIDTSILMEAHAETILNMNKSFKNNAKIIIAGLTTGFPTHTYCITIEEAKKVFKKHIHHYRDDPKYEKLWNGARAWVRNYLSVESSNHIIRYILPKLEKEE